MYKIISKRFVNKAETSIEMVVEAPLVAKHCKAGQFVILMPNEKSERIPLTIADYDREEGTVTIIFQPLGKTTRELGDMKNGEYISDFAGPLGRPTEIDGLKKVAVVGGGVGCAIALPVAKSMYRAGIEVDMIAGFRSDDVICLEEKMKSNSTKFYLMTDDGSKGEKGFTTDKLKELIDNGNKYDEVIAIGPLFMMKMVSAVTKAYGIKTIVSMNPVMIDGTGMCGCCRLTVNGETRFACVDGPEFNGHEIDWDEMIKRNSFYKNAEKKAEAHYCRLTGGIRNE